MKLNYGEKVEVRRTQYSAIWSATSRLLDCFAQSCSINTVFWILEIFSLLSVKYNFSDLMGVVYNDYFKVLNSSINFVSSFAAGKLNLVLGPLMDPINEITPLCPSIYELEVKFKNKNAHLLSDNKFSIINLTLLESFKFENELVNKMKYQCFKVNL